MLAQRPLSRRAAVQARLTLCRPAQPAGNPWRSPTLEWLPNGSYGSRSIPQVDGHEPLWQRPGHAEEVEAGGHWLPGTATGGRETLVTSPRRARPQHLLVLPGDSLWPVAAAFGTAAFFMLLTVKWVASAFAFGLLAVVGVLMWQWQTDRTPPGLASAAWATVGFLLSIALAARIGHGAATRPLPVARVAPLALALAAALAAVYLWLRGWAAAGLTPTAQAWSATMAALQACVGLHAVLLAVLAGYLGVRITCGLATPRQRATLECTQLLWWNACAQAVLVVWLPYAVVAAMGR